MSRTKKDRIKFPKERKTKNRFNIYGICRCRMCRWGRTRYKDNMILKAHRRFRIAWKTNKDIIKGIYTD